MLKLEYFYYMVEISRTGTINKAAENLYISQPYLSLALKEIEAELEVTLFKRNNKGVTITDAGKKFLEYSYEIIALVNKAKSLRKNCDLKAQRLSITSMYAFTMLDLFHHFSAKNEYKECKITYEEMPNKFIVEKVFQGATDLGIIYTTSKDIELNQKEWNENGLSFVPLVSEPLFAVLNIHHPLAQFESVRFSQLHAYNMILEKIKQPNKNAPVENNPFPELFKNSNVNSIMFDNNRSLFYYLTKNNDCFTVGQKSLNLTNPFVQSGLLKYIPIDDLKVHMITGYMVNTGFDRFALENDFIDYIETFFKIYNTDGTQCF
ncbi:MAG: LysR family transcriptional regulator [Tissierellales bacterium]|nr:LysR family transcriptional regulator [Tissierellales bacterium]